jgi:hypothetical protein
MLFLTVLWCSVEMADKLVYAIFTLQESSDTLQRDPPSTAPTCPQEWLDCPEHLPTYPREWAAYVESKRGRTRHASLVDGLSYCFDAIWLLASFKHILHLCLRPEI